MKDGDDARLVRLMNRAGRQRLHRDAVVGELIATLAHARPTVRRLACEALANLGGQRALEPLADLLEDPDEAVFASAHAALRRLTGLELAPERKAWLARLQADAGAHAPHR